MNARDKLLKAIDYGLLNADDVLREILVNWLDIDIANDCAADVLTDNNLDFDDIVED